MREKGELLDLRAEISPTSSIRLSVRPSIYHPSIYLSINLSIHPSISVMEGNGSICV